MPIETWFPLAIYYADLEGAAEQQDELLAAALALRQDNENGKRSPDAAWTGDVHGVQRLHDDPRFAWLIQRIERHALRYVVALGYQVEKVALHFQRSWPVIATNGQAVFRHSHPTSHLSAVYYIAIPQGAGGKLNFINEFKLNECSPGLTGHSDALVEGNPLNYTHVGYAPVEGRLMLFPSKIPHEVTAFQGEGEGARVSASFDIAITARRDELRPSYEFLTPDPVTWRPFVGPPHE